MGDRLLAGMKSDADMTNAAPQRKALGGLGLIVVVALALLGTFEFLLEILTLGGQGHTGWAIRPGPDQTSIAFVFPGSAAARAGVKPGDRIDLDRLCPTRRLYDPVISYHSPVGTRVDIPLIRGSQHITALITLEPVAAGPAYADVLMDFNDVLSFLVVLLGAWIVVYRPTLMSWGLFAFLLSNVTLLEMPSRFGYDLALMNGLVSAVLSSAGVFVIVFASRVPSDAPATWRRWFTAVALALFVVELIVGSYPEPGAYSIVVWSVLGFPSRLMLIPPSWLYIAINNSVYALTLIALCVNYAISRGQDRERMRWVALGVMMFIAAAILEQARFSTTYLSLFFDSLFIIYSIIYLSGMVAIAYGIVKGRIVDVTFVLSHAVVAAFLAAFIIAAFAIADWAVSKVLASARLGTLADIGLAVILGFSFDALRRRVDAIVDRLFFRRRYNAEERLKRAARAVLHANTLDAIRAFLVDEPHAALQLSSAALFEPTDASGWKRTRAIGWPSGTSDELAAKDTVVLQVLAKQSPLKTSSVLWRAPSLPMGLARPVLAVPVLARQRVVAIALYGQHRSGADIDADEIAEIVRVVDGADAAFDRVEAENLRRENEALARRIEELARRGDTPILRPGITGP